MFKFCWHCLPYNGILQWLYTTASLVFLTSSTFMVVWQNFLTPSILQTLVNLVCSVGDNPRDFDVIFFRYKASCKIKTQNLRIFKEVEVCHFSTDFNETWRRMRNWTYYTMFLNDRIKMRINNKTIIYKGLKSFSHYHLRSAHRTKQKHPSSLQTEFDPNLVETNSENGRPKLI